MSPSDNDCPRLLSAEEAAKYLGGPPLSARTLMNLARAQRVGHVKIGRTTRFPREALDAYIEAHTVQPRENPWGLTDAALQSIHSARPRRSMPPK